MMATLRLVRMPSEGLFRAGRWLDVYRYPPPARPLSLHQAIHDGYRWEDLRGAFPTMKMSGSAEAAIGRTIARYRRRLLPAAQGEPGAGAGFLDALKGWLTHDPEPGEPELVEGAVPRSYFEDAYLLHLPRGDDPDRCQFVDVNDQRTKDTIDAVAGHILTHLDPNWKHGDLSLNADRRVTRLVTRVLYDLTQNDDEVVGLRYPGHPDRHWQAFVAWDYAIELDPDTVVARPLDTEDPDVRAAADRLDISLP